MDLIQTEDALDYIRESQVCFCVMESDKEKKGKDYIEFGQCEKVPDKYDVFIPYDFIIVIYGPNVERFADWQMRILLLHELMHIGIEQDGNEESYYVRHHDIEDFREILDRYGIDWARNDKVGEAEKTRKGS